MVRRIGVVLVAVLVAVSACAPKTVPVPVVTTPQFPEFMRPAVPDALATSPAVGYHERGWTFLQAADLKSAGRELEAALKVAPDFYPSETAAGYVELAEKNPKAAVTRFDRALERSRAYVPALVGKGEALTALNREAEAVGVFEEALVVDASLADIRRRVEVMKFRGLERDLAAARAAAKSGKTEEAIRTYRAAIASSPESAFLYRELARIERDRAELDAALEHYRKALALEPTDAGALAEMGETLEAQGDIDGALKSYLESLAIEPNERVASRRDALRARLELAQLPEEYRSIESSPQLARGDLAALIGVRLAPLLQARTRDAGVITDIRDHWAESWILSVVRGGVMEAYANHTFQPRAAVRRVDFAQAVTRLLSKLSAVAPAQVSGWQSARLQFPDMAAGHLAYPAASAAVASGVMAAAPDGSFQPSRVVTGAEAVASIDRLQSLANLPGAQKIGRR
jgi:tetratricopeptide (TPR) repeat protein